MHLAVVQGGKGGDGMMLYPPTFGHCHDVKYVTVNRCVNNLCNMTSLRLKRIVSDCITADILMFTFKYSTTLKMALIY